MRAVRPALAAAVLLAAACAGMPDVTAPEGLPLDGSQVTYGMHLKLTQEGVVKADVYGDTAITPRGGSTTDVKGVRLVFYDEAGEPSGRLTSRTGEYDQQSGIMIARGGVVLVIVDEGGDRTIRTEELYYDQNGDRVWSEVATSIERTGETLHTQGFTSNTSFTRVTGENARTSAVKVDGGVRF